MAPNKPNKPAAKPAPKPSGTKNDTVSARGLGQFLSSPDGRRDPASANTRATIVNTDDGNQVLITDEDRVIAAMDGEDIEGVSTYGAANDAELPDACAWYASDACPFEYRRHYIWAKSDDDRLKEKVKLMPVTLKNHGEGRVPGAPGLREGEYNQLGHLNEGPCGRLYFMRAKDRQEQVSKAMAQYATKVKDAQDGERSLGDALDREALAAAGINPDHQFGDKSRLDTTFGPEGVNSASDIGKTHSAHPGLPSNLNL